MHGIDPCLGHIAWQRNPCRQPVPNRLPAERVNDMVPLLSAGCAEGSAPRGDSRQHFPLSAAC